MKTARECVLLALNKMEEDASYSNLILDKTLDQAGLSLQERTFASALFYGVLERKITLDYGVERYSKIPLRKISTDIFNILRMGLYQLIWMESVPDSAAVNESVRLVYAVKKVSAKGFVNALLRSFIRDGKKIPLPKEPSRRLEVEYSAPRWLIAKWQEEYGEETALKLLKASVGAPPLYLRVNTLKITAQELAEDFSRHKREASPVGHIPGALVVKGIGSIRHMPAYKKGLFHVQDLASQTLCRLLHPNPGEIVYDMCSAPGGKAFTMAQYMEDKGELYAFDLHENRVKLIEQGANRLGIQCIHAQTGDAARFCEGRKPADKVLCDVPCSGLGIIRRKPEIKYKDPKDFDRLPEIQYRILQTSAGYVRPGGVLMYSTCTLSRAENDEVSERFLRENPAFIPAPLPGKEGHSHTFFPDEMDSDGFYLAMFQRKG